MRCGLDRSLFRTVFPGGFNRYQAAFAPLHTLRPVEDENEPAGVFKIAVPDVPGHRQELIALYDANAIGDYIQWACEGNLRLARSGRAAHGTKTGCDTGRFHADLSL